MSVFSNIHEDGNKLRFTIKGVDVSVVNSVRRIILAEIPCVAIYFDPYDQEKKHIEIHKNTGVLHNEFLSHRISLLPFWFTNEEIANYDPESYKYVLKIKNTGNEVVHVTTKDIQIFDKTGKKMPEAFHEHVFPKCPITKDYILITKLMPNLYDNQQGEEIDLECKATVGIAKEHARWSVVSKCSYYNEVDPIAEAAALQEKIKGMSPEEAKKATSGFQVLERYRYFKKNSFDDPDEFVFMIDSECRLTPKEIFAQALDVFKSKFESLIEKLDDLKVTPSLNYFEVEIKNENHTLLNPLQALIYNRCFRQLPENPLEYIGYYQTHALDNTMILKLRYKDKNANVRECIKEECKHIISYIVTLRDAWMKV